MNTSLPDENILYEALLRRDSHFEGIFIVGVKTTGIFCRPTCPAKKPKRENVEFFSSVREALLHGYRPCKMCSPLGLKGDIPPWLKPVMDEIQGAPDFRLKDSDLRERGVDPHRARRWFKRHHGMTFQAYLRTLRIGQAFGRMKHGGSVSETALDSGYNSLSGFTESFKKTTGFSPSRSRHDQLITVTRILTPLGPMIAGAVDEGICLFEFVDRRMLETNLEVLKQRLQAEIVPGSHTHFEVLHQQMDEYFAGTRREFELPLVLAGTDFQQRVWEALRTIPYGTTRSYAEQATLLKAPQAIRAVARANGQNRIAIIIPCHRVIGKDGRLVGYGGGLWRKKHLLDHEKKCMADEAAGEK